MFLRNCEGVHIAVVACGDRLDETLTMIKSVLLFSIGNVNLHIFADDELKEKFECTVSITEILNLFNVMILTLLS